VKFFGPKSAAFRRDRVISANVVGSGKGVEDENGIGSILVESAPGGVGKLGRRNASAVAEGEISEREE
jgi:hypothetical protein